MRPPADHQRRLQRARQSLDGLSVGDAFGECFFSSKAMSRIAARATPPAPWRYTDDTVMALDAGARIPPAWLAARERLEVMARGADTLRA